MNISVTMNIHGFNRNERLETLSNEELKNLVLTCRLAGIVIDTKSIMQIHNALWDDRKGGPRCDLAWDEEFTETMDWHEQMSDG
jgi:thiamine biosynthesis protein ThiC